MEESKRYEVYYNVYDYNQIKRYGCLLSLVPGIAALGAGYSIIAGFVFSPWWFFATAASLCLIIFPLIHWKKVAKTPKGQEKGVWLAADEKGIWDMRPSVGKKLIPWKQILDVELKPIKERALTVGWLLSVVLSQEDPKGRYARYEISLRGALGSPQDVCEQVRRVGGLW